MQVNLVVLAIPIFLTLIGIEQLITWRQARRGLSLEDAVSNLGCGMLQQFVQLPIRTASFAAYVWVYGHFRVVELPSNPWTWALCFLGVDFLAYWYHRLSHRVAMLWAAHEVHHQSEGLDLTVSLRVPAFDYYYWAFDLPLAFFGFPPGMFLVASSVVSIYGFSSHTRTIRRLGPLEWLFVTPAHHRLHHARNREYLDRNYSKVLILWDRIFGTFVEEAEEPIYGITTPLRSWNPLWANVHPFAELVRKLRRTRRLADGLRVLIRPPAWSPADADKADEGEPTRQMDAARADGAAGPLKAPRGYVLAQFLPTMLVTIALLNVRGQLAISTLALGAALVAATMATLGGLLDGRSWARRVEVFRVGVVGGLAVLMISSWLPAAAAVVTFSAAASAASRALRVHGE
jgi:sterol desaturase/sphingolipid hydroxylase (fatty acid hydroxylase superfamily)